LYVLLLPFITTAAFSGVINDDDDDDDDFAVTQFSYFIHSTVLQM